MTRPLTVLVASDGSPAARAAVSLASHVPWPDDTRVVGIVATATPPAVGPGILYRDALVHAYHSEAQAPRRVPAGPVR
jgi:hypothetical protein